MPYKKRTLSCPNPDQKGAHELALHCWGEDDNPKVLICVHGMTRNGRDFDFLAQALEKEYRIICPDMPGRGESAWLLSPADYSYPTYMMDMMHLLAQLGVAKVDWVGTSLGGILGMLMAALEQQVISKMVINDIGPFIPKEALAQLATYVGVAKYFKDEAAALSYIKDIYAAWHITDEAHFLHIVKHSLRQTDKGLTFGYDPAIGAVFRNEDGTPKPQQDINLWEVWGKILCPILLLRGGKSEIFPKEVAEKMQATHKALTFVEYPQAGHAPSLMEEAQIEGIRKFLLGN